MSYLAKEKFHLRASSEMIVARIVTSFGFAMVATLTSIYLKDTGLSDSQIGYVMGGASMLAIGAAFLVPPILERFDEVKVYFYTTLALGLTYFVLGFVGSAWIAAVIYVVSRLIIMLRDNANSIVFRDVAKNKEEYSKAQGIAGSLGNFSWFVGPVLGGLMLNEYGIEATFTLGALFFVLGAALFLIMPIRLRHKKRTKIDTDWLENIKFYLSRRNLIIAYVQRFGISMWWAFIWTFIPLFMIENGYTAAQVGITIGLTQLPLFLLEFWTVTQVKKLGYRAIFVGSYALMAAVMLLSFSINNIDAIIYIILVGSVSLAFLEPASEMFLFDQVTKEEEEKSYPIYNTASSVGSILGTLLIGASIGFLGARSVYAVMTLLCMGIVVAALHIKKKPASR